MAKANGETTDKDPGAWPEALLIALVFLHFANAFVIQTFYIPSGSMEQTLLIGDHLFVNRFIYGATASDLERRLLPQRPVQRGDVLVFRSVEEPGIDVVKRCVALAGDRVEISNKHLYINGQRVQDDAYAIHGDSRVFPRLRGPDGSDFQRDQFGPLEIPHDHVFCLGDNRDFSHDSRFWGPLPVSRIKGRALLIYWSNGADVTYGEGLGNRLAQAGRSILGFPTKTRWERTFQLIR